MARTRLGDAGGFRRQHPRIMFEWMARQNFDWRHVDLYWVDERCVPIDDQQSNYRMTRESLLESIHLAAGQLHRIHGEIIPDEAAILYADDISRSFKLQPGELPVFDVIQRAWDRYAPASLFPGEPLILNHTGSPPRSGWKSSNSTA